VTDITNGSATFTVPTLNFTDWNTAGGQSFMTNGSSFYANLMPGGTIVNAQWSYSGQPLANWSVTDITNGSATFTVPTLNFTDWNTEHAVPIISTLHHISPFDLLKVTCISDCQASGVLTNVEMSGGYAFENIAGHSSALNAINTGAYSIRLFANVTDPPASFPVPRPNANVCINVGDYPSTLNCTTLETVPTGGSSRSLGSGPSAVVAGNMTLMSYGPTMQNLVNNTMTMAYDYWLTLRALTNDGQFAIPPNCAVPTPSDAFPDATDFANYQLSSANIEIAYLSYLNAVARAYDSSFTNGEGWCGDSNLVLHYNLTATWDPALNITASEYYYGAQGAESVSGASLPNESYSNVSTWAIRGSQPVLLYPFEYQMDVPVGTTYAIPVNDPVVSLLLNYAGNQYYGELGSPSWGLPTYSTMNGAGNFVYANGTLSGYASGRAAGSGDAINISACVLNGVPQSTCDISVTYFNIFAIGLVHGLQSPRGQHITNNYPLGTTNDCGFGVLSAWYDSWLGYAGSVVANAFSYFGNMANGIPIIGGGLSYLIKGIGCIVAWIVVIAIVGLFLYVALKIIVPIIRGGVRATARRSENVH
jgi:hypothetical protein